MFTYIFKILTGLKACRRQLQTEVSKQQQVLSLHHFLLVVSCLVYATFTTLSFGDTWFLIQYPIIYNSALNSFLYIPLPW